MLEEQYSFDQNKVLLYTAGASKCIWAEAGFLILREKQTKVEQREGKYQAFGSRCDDVLSIFNVSKFWLCYHVNLVFKVGIITSPQIYCTTHHIKSQLAKIVPCESVTKIVALEEDSQSAEYLTISISKK